MTEQRELAFEDRHQGPFGTTATARLTCEISSASNSTQRPPIVPTPTIRLVAAARRHTRTHTYTLSGGGGGGGNPSGVSTRLPQDPGVERGCPAFRVRQRVFLTYIYMHAYTYVYTRLSSSLPFHAIDGRTSSRRKRERERDKRGEKNERTLHATCLYLLALPLSHPPLRPPPPPPAWTEDTVSEKSIDTLLVIRVDKKYRYPYWLRNRKISMNMPSSIRE